MELRESRDGFSARAEAAAGTASVVLADRDYDWRATVALDAATAAAARKLIEWAESTAESMAGTRADKVLLIRVENPPEGAVRAALSEAGYELSVEEDEMGRATASVPPPSLPRDFTLRAWDEATAPLFYRAFYESFRERPRFPGYDEARWRASFASQTEFRADLSRVVLDGDEPAAFATLWLEEGVGWVVQIGVRPAWRGKGLGEALLNHAIGAFAGEGIETIALEVATDNPVARALYQRMGFEVTGSYRSWRKELA